MKQAALVHRISLEPNPALLEHARQRADSVQNRIADRITTFAGSMAFQGGPRLRGRTTRRHLAFASSGQVPSLSGCSGGVAASSTRNSRTPCTKPLQNATGRSWSGALIKLQSMADRVSSALRDWATRRSFARSSDVRAAYSRPASSPLSKDLRSSFTKVF